MTRHTPPPSSPVALFFTGLVLLSLVACTRSTPEASPARISPSSEEPAASKVRPIDSRPWSSDTPTDPRPLVYRLSFPEPHTHYVEVHAVVPVDPGQPTTLWMPTWTPGS
ncbi:MAG: hypothetical protein QGG40_22045, partial [Myxococcota bacterium]|nr:hypothetical protein [Myxococcota bacterium]